MIAFLTENSVQAAPANFVANTLNFASITTLHSATVEVVGAKVYALCAEALRTILIKKTVVTVGVVAGVGLGSTAVTHLAEIPVANSARKRVAIASLAPRLQATGPTTAKQAEVSVSPNSSAALKKISNAAGKIAPDVVDEINTLPKPNVFEARFEPQSHTFISYALKEIPKPSSKGFVGNLKPRPEYSRHTNQDYQQENKHTMKKMAIVAVVGSQLLSTAVVQAQPPDPEPQPKPRTKPLKAAVVTSQTPGVLGPLIPVNGANAVPQQEAGKAMLWYTIPVRHTMPRLMAWYIDPTHNPEPQELASQRRNARVLELRAALDPNAPKKPQGFRGVALEGVGSIVPVDAQSCLLVFGTEAGAKAVQELVGLLDRRIEQVEIEASFVEISTEDTKEFGINFGPEAELEGNKRALGFVRGNFMATLNKMVQDKKAKIIQMPRVTTLNNTPASVFTTTSVPAVVGLNDGAFKPFFDAPRDATEPPLFLATASGISVTPTINADDSITMLVSSGKALLLTHGPKQRQEISQPHLIRSQTPISSFANVPEQSEPMVLRTQNGISSIVNVTDGDTIALTGLTSESFSFFKPTAPDEAEPANPSNIVLFVTARRIRRAPKD